jgi:hypothetical protein
MAYQGTMTVSKRTLVDDDGSLSHILEYDDGDDVDFDAIVVKHDPDDDSRMVCVGYVGEDEQYRAMFKRRSLQFDPISVIGRGQTERLEGISDAEGDSSGVPPDISTAVNSIGFTVVPNGEWWLDE